ncbi:peptidase C15 pyroglutamyl peptidase I-like protein [Wolfiporia cocos MD-104 SS10]|uniref:Peptidase C15 pyroglutamyl peptidase I-like protein n=1 Tax=Wolfiporia cocos (strain MD-104) TaxID=742152 RepID=A0A2H3JUP8_WOLCO|nr:peptidase C15 pyroglutamyl peptidase I-like protein [Wolfiporia cocos MD-104 SS10]
MSPAAVPENALRVLITGYGPFRTFKLNPSWLAVKPLHNTVLHTDAQRPVHITSLEVPTTYDAVLSVAPCIHARPPVLPAPADLALALARPPPPEGYDFVVHVGVVSRSGTAMRMEQRGRKFGYDQEDAEGRLCPVVSGGEQPMRGFGEGYEAFPEELWTSVDCPALVRHLGGGGLQHVTLSTDAGLYLCEFINYCSMAESRRTAAKGEKYTPTLFVHIPPVGEPLSTEEVSDALRKTIAWVCSRLPLSV